jgi:hypothetical protein
MKANPLLAQLQRFLSGLRRTDLVADLAAGGPHTLVAPVNAAFDVLPWSFDRLLSDDELLEPRFDLFEYLVLRGACDGEAPLHARRTLQGESLVIGAGIVRGHQSKARILGTTTWQANVVVAVDACVLPSSILRYEARPWYS